MKFIFYLKYQTHFGESLLITGNAKELSAENGMIEMQYFNKDYWCVAIDIDISHLNNHILQYSYVFKNADGTLEQEFAHQRKIIVERNYTSSLKIYDTWNFAGAYANTFETSPFQKILLPKHGSEKIKIPNHPTHVFKVKAPLLDKDEVICLLGNVDALNEWNTNKPHLLRFDGEHWVTGLDLKDISFPIAYKYGVYNIKKKTFVKYEAGSNRVCFEQAHTQELVLLQDGFINIPDDTWRGAGVAIPVFSLRSKNSLGVGEFSDLKLLADWAVKTGLKLIQILPINDTTATNTWTDSYPYAAISAFALHPIYINLDAIDGKKSKAFKDALKINRKKLNALSKIDYEAVMKFKITALKELFDNNGNDCLKSADYKTFFEKNKHWLKSYATFCYLRDKYASPNPADWETNTIYHESDIDKFFQKDAQTLTQLQFYCYVQYQLHIQLSNAVDYAHKKNIVIKGDIPIGVYRFGCDAWMHPELYKMDLQVGAPPDDFAVNGQNWGFPTYNWQKMQADNFAWWRKRFEKMSDYFDAFRIDHILGFFRIWSIPLDAVQGIMGKFDPSISVHLHEFGEEGIWIDYERFCLPHITDDVLYELFNENAEQIKTQFLQKCGPQQYRLRAEFDTQKKVALYFEEHHDKESILLRDGLYNLIGNVILFEQEGSEKTAFHFRISIDKTSSFQHLQPQVREKIWNLYIDYYYRRQNNLWRNEALSKLPQLKAATNMLVCGEDLGMVPESVPGVMKQLGILSLEIQRMPKKLVAKFFNPADAPYLSVVTPSTHDMSTIRGWWQEDKNTTQYFYNIILEQNGKAPQLCEPWINRAIILQHLYSPAMWSIFQLQDILSMNDESRIDNPDDERINIPANPQHYWRYRMHITLEELLNEKIFNQELKGYVENSGRV